MNVLLIFLWIWAAMVATAFWEAYVEGRRAWGEGKLGWKFDIGFTTLTAYHFYLFCVMYPLLVFLPLMIGGWDTRLFGVLLTAYLTGLVIEDFCWFLVNPAVKLKEFGPEFVDWYPWFILGPVKIPVLYVVDLAGAALSWWFLWR